MNPLPTTDGDLDEVDGGTKCIISFGVRILFIKCKG